MVVAVVDIFVLSVPVLVLLLLGGLTAGSWRWVGILVEWWCSVVGVGKLLVMAKPFDVGLGTVPAPLSHGVYGECSKTKACVYSGWSRQGHMVMSLVSLLLQLSLLLLL